MARKRRTRQEQSQADYDEIRAWTNADYLQRPEVIAELEKQGVPVSQLNTSDFDEETAQETVEETQPEIGLDVSLEKKSDALTDLLDAQEELEAENARREAADKLKAENADKLKAFQQNAADTVQQNIGAVKELQRSTIGKVRENVNAVTEKIGSMATPGGLMTPFIILMALVIFLINVRGNGGDSEPRFIWSWLVLTRKARLIPETAIPEKMLNPPHEIHTQDNSAMIIDIPSVTIGQYSRYFSE